MKKTLVVLMLILIAGLSFTGCDKEPIIKERSLSFDKLPKELKELYNRMPIRDYGNISVLDGNILHFETKSQYEMVGQLLLDECRQWDSLFCTAYGYMSEEQMQDWEKKTGYNEFLPLYFFEERCGVSGQMLFDNQEYLLKQWMENGLQGQDPTDNIFNLESDQAMHNLSHEVCVADTIYQYREDAIIEVPVSMLQEWKDLRRLSTEELENHGGIKVVRERSIHYRSLSDMPPHHNFICRDKDNVLTKNNFSTLGAKDKSVWSLVGRRGLTYSHVATYKLVNYEYVRTKEDGTDVFQKVRRQCSMVPHISFSTEQYEQLYQNFQNWYRFDGFLNEPLPDNENVKTYSDKFQYQHLPINYLSNDYHFGIFTDNASVIIRIGSQSTTMPQNYNVIFQ